MDAAEDKPYESLTAMRAAYVELSESVGADILTPANVRRVREFILRGAATGVALDSPKERSAAQGQINFWVARLGAASRTADGTEDGPSDIGLSFERTLLADFDAATVKQVADAAEAWFTALSPDNQASARRALMRMVVLPADGKSFALCPVPRAALDSFGHPEQIEAGLAKLVDKQILRLTPGETPGAGLVALRYEALMREWPRMAGWLDKRLRFRQAVRYWQANGQAPSALIRDDLLDEAQEYHDLDKVELDFIAASGKREREENRRERHLHRWFVGLSAATIVGAVAAVILLWVAYQAATARGEAEKAKKEVVMMQKEGLIADGLADSITTSALIELLTKHDAHYAKKLLIIQILGQLVSAPSEEAWSAAKANWEALEKDLKEDPAPDDEYWFKNNFFPGKAKEGDGMTNLERIKLLRGESRADSYDHRIQLYWISKDLRRWLRPRLPGGVKDRWYAVAQLTADALSKAARDGRTFDEITAFEGLFWRLYLGEMVLVESENVEGKMVQFGDFLKEWEQEKGKAPRDLTDRMEAAAKELQEVCDSEKGGRPGG